MSGSLPALLAGATCAGLFWSSYAIGNAEGLPAPMHLGDAKTNELVGATLDDICDFSGQLSVIVDRPALPTEGARVLIERKPFGFVASLVPGPEIATTRQAVFDLDRLIARHGVPCGQPVLVSPIKAIGVMGLRTITQEDGSQTFEFRGVKQ